MNTKYVFFLFFAIGIVSIFSACNNAAANAKTEQIKVWGNCGMCENTIEGALVIEGILEADWDRKTDILTVVYDSLKINNSAIQKSVADSGYDTENVYASDSVYQTLHSCCLYERKPKE